MHNFHIYTAVYGSHYVELFRKACFRSMNWPLNKAAVSGSTWNIYTKPEHFAEFEEMFKGSGFKLQLFQMGESMRVAGCGFVKTSQCDGGVILLNGLRDQIYQCQKENKRLLLAPPDTIFGDGTVANLIALGSVAGACVAVSHPRVLPTIIDDIEYLAATRGAMSNASLVTLAMKHAHDSWKFAEIGNEKNSSFIGGIAWKQLGPGLYSVQHRLPTAYFVDFNTTDWDFWWGQVSFGSWDHRWPAENLIRQERQRLVGSSDACFIVEVTEWDKNVPPNHVDNQVRDEDAYWNAHYHNEINRQTTVIYRGE